jgi:hypothetical protein
MDRRYIDDHHVVARYLANRLTDEEHEAFEAYYLEHPDMVQEMEAAARFKVGLMTLRDTGELKQLLQQEKRPRWQYLAAAAAVAALTVGTFLVIDRTPDSHPILAASFADLLHADGGPPTLVRQYAILRTRGSAVDADITLPAPGSALELRVLPEFAARPERYRVQLFRMSADDSMQSVAELGALAPEPDNFVSVFVDGARLQPGQYRLTIAGDPDTDARDKESAFILRMRAAVNDPSAESR